MTEFRLRRVSLSPLIETAQEEDRNGGSWPHLGGDFMHFANVPNVFQALAHPEGTHDFAQAPQRGRVHHSSDIAYWHSLLFLLVHSFGWRKPGLGLKWWEDAGRPCDDDRFALIDQTWLADGLMQWFEAWVQHQSFGLRGEWRSSDMSSHLLVPETQSRHLEQLDDDIALVLPFGSGTDRLHLASHLGSDWGTSELDELILDSEGGPRGVLFTDRVQTFRNFLNRAPALQDEHPSGRSWRIDVICKQIGWLGTYRRSRVTGYWFAGKHSIHMVGHPG